MGFETPQLKLPELLTDVQSGRIQLPDFQRGYKWDDERIRELLVTVLRGHPMGALMQLAHADDAVVRFKPQPLARVVADADANGHRVDAPEYLLLDGQQRMTSLFQALMGSGVVETKDSRGKGLRRRYFLDVELALGDPEEQDRAVISLPEDGIRRKNIGRDIEMDLSTHGRQTQEGIMPFTALFDGSDTKWFFDYTRASDDQAHRFGVFEQFSNEVTSQVKGYVIPAIRLDKSTTKEAVATVFEKVNSGGLPLNNFELLTAVFAGDADYFAEHGDDFRLGEDWAAHREVFEPHPVLSGVREIDFLQAVLLLATLERRRADEKAGRPKPRAVSARGEDVLKLTLPEYLRWAPRVRDGFIWAAGFYLREHIHTARWLPYQTQTVPLAVFRVLLGDHIDHYPVLARIRQWYWNGVLSELYGSTTETRFARDTEQVPPWALSATSGADHPAPKSLDDGIFRESRLLSLRTRGSAAYKGIYALLLKSGARDWKRDQAIDHASYLELGIDIHHIFPKAWCNKNGISEDSRESIINKTPIASSTNRELGGASPAVYLPRLESNMKMEAGQVDRLLTGHLIDPVALRAADFETFFDSRREALIRVIEDVMGKPVVRDIIQADTGELTGSEAPAAFEPEVPDSEPDTDALTVEEFA